MAGVVIALILAAIVMIALGVIARQVRREDRLYSLPEDAPSVMARGARRLNGFGRRDLVLQVLTSGRRAAA